MAAVCLREVGIGEQKTGKGSSWRSVLQLFRLTDNSSVTCLGYYSASLHHIHLQISLLDTLHYKSDKTYENMEYCVILWMKTYVEVNSFS